MTNFSEDKIQEEMKAVEKEVEGATIIHTVVRLAAIARLGEKDANETISLFESNVKKLVSDLTTLKTQAKEGGNMKIEIHHDQEGREYLRIEPKYEVTLIGFVESKEFRIEQLKGATAIYPVLVETFYS